MMIAFAKDNNKNLLCRDTEESTIIKVAIKDILTGKVTVDNIYASNNKILGKKFNIDKLSNNESNIGRSYVYKKLLSSDGNTVLGYFALTNKGKRIYVESDNVAKGFKYGIVNGNIINNKLELKNEEYIQKDKQYKKVSYSADEYLEVYNMYNENSLICNVVKIECDQVYAAEHKTDDGYSLGINHYSKTSMSNFIESHKILSGLLIKSEMIRLVKIYKSFSIENNTVIVDKHSLENKDFVYKLNFKCMGIYKTILIHKKDNRLLSIIKNKGIRLSKTNIEDIRELIEYTNIDENDKNLSITTLVDISDSKREKRELNKLLNNNSGHLELKNDSLKSNENSFYIRKDIRIGSNEFKIMEFTA